MFPPFLMFSFKNKECQKNAGAESEPAWHVPGPNRECKRKIKSQSLLKQLLYKSTHNFQKPTTIHPEKNAELETVKASKSPLTLTHWTVA